MDIGVVVALAAIGVFFWGLFGLILPRKAGFQDRYRAFAASLFSLVLLGIGVDYFPDPKAPPAEGPLLPGTLMLWVAWVGFIWFRPIYRRKAEAWRIQLKERDTQLRESIDRNQADIPERMKPEAGILATPEKSPVSELRFEYADTRGRISKRSVINWTEEGNYIEGWCIDQRAERTFRKDHILQWLDGTEKLLRSPSSRRKQYKMVERPGGKVLRVGNSKVYNRYGPPIQGPVSERISLEYQNRYGEISYHTLHDWYEYDRHVSGWCTESRSDRQFSKKLVVEWFGNGESLLLRP